MARGGTSVPSDRLSRRAASDTLNCSDIHLSSLVLVAVTATATQVQRAELRISGRMSAERRERGRKKFSGLSGSDPVGLPRRGLYLIRTHDALSGPSMPRAILLDSQTLPCLPQVPR